MKYKLVIDKKALLTLEILVPDEENGGFKKDTNGEFITETCTYQLSYTYQIENFEEMARKEKAETNNEVFKDYTIDKAAGTPWWQVILPYALAFIALIAIWFFLMRGAPGTGKMNNFAKSKAKVMGNDKDAVKFCDVAGADEEKSELEEVVEFLKDPAKFVKLGARKRRFCCSLIN